MTPIIGMLVGNGLAIDYRAWAHPALADLNPSDPIRWTFKVPDKNGIPWQGAFPIFARAIEPFQHLSSFEIFGNLLSGASSASLDSDSSIQSSKLDGSLDWEARQFLSFAFVEFHERYNDRSMNGWPWAEWIRTNGRNIQAAISFNYEMLLEIALMHYGRTDLWVLADNEMKMGRTLVYKPHGSIDYTTSAVTWMNIGLPSKRFMSFCDLPIRLADQTELRNIRPQPYTILPSEASHYRWYQYFHESVDHWCSVVAPRLTHVLMVGLSYFPCDRWELDELLSCVNREATFIVANPSPDPLLRTKLVNSGRKYVEWKAEPQSI